MSSTDLEFLHPTTFVISDIHGLEDLMHLRFKLFDLLEVYSGKKEHAHLVSDLEAEWEGEDNGPVEYQETRVRNGAEFSVKSYMLNHRQVMRLFSRFTGSEGRRTRRAVERYIGALECIALERDRAAREAQTQLAAERAANALFHTPWLGDIFGIIHGSKKLIAKRNGDDPLLPRMKKADYNANCITLVEDLALLAGDADLDAMMAHLKREVLEAPK